MIPDYIITPESWFVWVDGVILGSVSAEHFFYAVRDERSAMFPTMKEAIQWVGGNDDSYMDAYEWYVVINEKKVGRINRLPILEYSLYSVQTFGESYGPADWQGCVCRVRRCAAW